jgi:hypothetical protein
MGAYAFSECSALTSVDIPHSVTKIGRSCFAKCTNLTTFAVDEGNPAYCSVDGILFNKEKTVLATYPMGKSATSYSIPHSVTSIGDDAFYGCTVLTSVTIPNSLTGIGSGAFSGCTGLTSVTIPNSVTSVGGYAFRTCTGLTSVRIPDSVTSMGDGAFINCTGLTSATISHSLTSIGKYAFALCTGLTSIIIPNSVTSIGDAAFNECYGLTSISIPNSVTSIGYDAFSACMGLTSLTIPNSVKDIGRYAFSGCRALTSVTVSWTNPAVVRIGDIVFFSVDVSKVLLYVPGGSESRYRNLLPWKDFKIETSTAGETAGVNPLRLSPNPASEDVTVSGLHGRETINIFDISGRRWLSRRAAKATEDISIRQLPAGIYLVRVTMENEVQTLKLIVKTP